MRNAEVAEALHELADYAEVTGDTWEGRAYRKAARTIEDLTEPVEDLHSDGKLTSLAGIGEGTAKKIAAQLDTGTMPDLERVRAEVPIDVPGLLAVRGLGPKGIKKLHEALGIETLEDLEAAAEEGTISDVSGFGKRTQAKILEHIGFVRRVRDQRLLVQAEQALGPLLDALAGAQAAEQIAVAGAVRRRCPTVTVPRILVATEDAAAVRLVVDQLDADPTVELVCTPPDRWGAALVQATGSQAHLQELKRLAEDQGYTLEAEGLHEAGGAHVATRDEQTVYGSLGLPWIPPELREGRGEVQAAGQDALPELVTLDEVRGDLQMHTTWSDGATSILEMARKGDELGYAYILVTDHGPSLTVAGGPSEEELPEQGAEIAQVNEQVELTVLHGCEANITSDGIDISQAACRELDLVVASLHDHVQDATERVVHAIEAYPVNIFAHPTNRLLGKREGNDLDMARILEACEAHHVAVEINAQPNRLDLDWQEVHRFRDAVPYVLSTDAHAPQGMELMHLAVDQARKGWLTTEHVLNAQPLDRLVGWLRP